MTTGSTKIAALMPICLRRHATPAISFSVILSTKPGNDSKRQRIGPKLESNDLGLRPFAAFAVERGAVPSVVHTPRPFQPAFGSSMQAVHALDVESERVGGAQGHELAVDQRQQALGAIAGGDRHVGLEPQGVELVDPRVIAGFGAARAGVVRESRLALLRL